MPRVKRTPQKHDGPNGHAAGGKGTLADLLGEQGRRPHKRAAPAATPEWRANLDAEEERLRNLPGDRLERGLEAGRRAAKFKATYAEQLAAGDLPPLAEEPDLIGAIQADIETIGVVGERDNALLIYEAYTSRVQEDPLAVITRGKTGSGKTTLLEKIGCLHPPEAKVDAMRFTDAALFNTPADYLKHKILICGERKHSTDDATRDANAMLRQLLSEKRITRLVSVQGEKGEGRWRSEAQQREGPVAYAESTTAGSIFEEDLNRVLQIYVDESPAQSRNVALAVAQKYAPDAAEVQVDAVVKRHHDFQKSLEGCRVVVPYAERLARLVPVKHRASRRSVQQVFSVIEATALLHQHRRKRDGKGRLLATRDDYALARRLLLAPLHDAMGLGERYREYVRLRKALPASEFTSNAALAHFANKMTRDRTLKALAQLGVLEQVEAGSSHKPARWRWLGGPKALSLDALVLPSVDAVCGKLS